MTSYIRVLHASPNAPAVDIYANDDLIVENLSFKEISPYLSVPPATYNIRVYPAGTKNDPVIDTDVYIPPNSVFNVAAIGTLPNISLYPIPEPSIVQESGNACVRFVHLSPDAPAVDIQLGDGTIAFNDVSYKGISNYICLPPDTYTFKVVPTGSNDIVLTVPDVALSGNIYYTIYALGLIGETPNLEAMLITEPREA